MAEAIINHASKSREYKTIIFFDPPERKSDVENWLPNNDCKFFPQEGNYLGERMANAFSKAFSLGAEKAVIIGTDCIDISNDLISETFATLDITDVILGPAEDGGYYLLGLKKLIPEIFNNIDWSTDRVLNQTLKTLREKGLRFQLLQTLKDIDTANDLNDELLFKIHERVSDQ